MISFFVSIKSADLKLTSQMPPAKPLVFISRLCFSFESAPSVILLLSVSPPVNFLPRENAESKFPVQHH